MYRWVINNCAVVLVFASVSCQSHLVHFLNHCNAGLRLKCTRQRYAKNSHCQCSPITVGLQVMVAIYSVPRSTVSLANSCLSAMLTSEKLSTEERSTVYGQWWGTTDIGYPEKIVMILENAYKDTFSAMRVGGSLMEWFKTVVSVLQGDVLSPLLFAIFFWRSL